MLRAAALNGASDAARRAAIEQAIAQAKTPEARAQIAQVVREAGLDPHAMFPNVFTRDDVAPLPAAPPTGIATGKRDASTSALGVVRFAKKDALSSAARALASADPQARGFDPSRRSDPYDVRAELPNLFGAPATTKIAPAELAARKELLSSALGSVLRRVEIPVPDGKGGFTQTRFFDRLPQELRATTTGGPRVLASGGVIRAALAYLYREMLAGMQREPQVAPEATLLSIADGKGNVPAHLVRGVNSDWDMLLDCEPKDAPKWKAAVMGAVQGAFNEAGGHARLKLGAHFERSLFLVADVKEYAPQLALTSAQGGSDLDWLAFDIARGSFVEPKESPGILDRLVGEGTFRFHPPRDVSQMKDPQDTALRALRPFLELPFLRVDDPAPLLEALSDVERRIGKGERSSERAVGQIAKALANAVEGGAHNRLQRDGDDVMRRLTAVANRAAESANAPGIKRFVDSWPIPEAGRALGGLPRELLMPVGELVAKHTTDGAVFHGTPSLESALAMARGGMFVSDAEQGRALYGRGGYATKELDTARQYAGREGVVFLLPLALDRELHVLHWPSVASHPFMKELVQRAGSLDAAFEILARDHGIDVIVNTHVVVQNAAALKFPSSPAELVEGYASVLENPATQPATLVAALGVYQSLYAYAAALGKTLKPPADYLPRLRELAVTRPREEVGDDMTSLVHPLSQLALEAYARIYDQLLVFEPARAKKTPPPLMLHAEIVRARCATPVAYDYDDANVMREYISAFVATPKEERGGAPSPMTMAKDVVRLSLHDSGVQGPALLTLLRLQKSGVLAGNPVALVEELVATLAKEPRTGLKLLDDALAALGDDRKRVRLTPLAAPLLEAALGPAGGQAPDDLEPLLRRYVEIWSSASAAERARIPHPESTLARIAKHAEAGARTWFLRPARIYEHVYEAAGKPKGAPSPAEVAWTQLSAGARLDDTAVVEIAALAKLDPPAKPPAAFLEKLALARTRIDAGDLNEISEYAAILRALGGAASHDVKPLLARSLAGFEKHLEDLAQDRPEWSPWPGVLQDLVASMGRVDDTARLRALMVRAAKLEGNDERTATALVALERTGDIAGIKVPGVNAAKRDALVEQAIVHGNDTHDWLVRGAYTDRDAVLARLAGDPPPHPRGAQALLAALPSTSERARWAEEFLALIDADGPQSTVGAVALLVLTRPSAELKAKAEAAIATSLIEEPAVLARCAELIKPTLWELAQRHYPADVAHAASALLARGALPPLGRDDAFHGPTLEHLVRAALGQLPAPSTDAAARLEGEAKDILLERAETVGPVLAALSDEKARPLALRLLSRARVPAELQGTYAGLLDDPEVRLAFAKACAVGGRAPSPLLRAKAHALLEGVTQAELKSTLEDLARRSS